MPLPGEYGPNALGGTRSQVDLHESSGGTRATTIAGRPVVVVSSRGARTERDLALLLLEPRE
jgi:hypothetical protein